VELNGCFRCVVAISKIFPEWQLWVGSCRSGYLINAEPDAAVHEAGIGHFRTLTYFALGSIQTASANASRLFVNRTPWFTSFAIIYPQSLDNLQYDVTPCSQSSRTLASPSSLAKQSSGGLAPPH